MQHYSLRIIPMNVIINDISGNYRLEEVSEDKVFIINDMPKPKK